MILPYGTTPSAKINTEQGKWPFYVHHADDDEMLGWFDLCLDTHDEFQPRVYMTIFGVPALLNLREGLSVKEGRTHSLTLENQFERIEFGRYGNRLHVTIYMGHLTKYNSDDSPRFVQWRFAFLPSPEQIDKILEHINKTLVYFNHVPTGNIEFEQM